MDENTEKNTIPQSQKERILEKYSRLTKEQKLEVTKKIREIQMRKRLQAKPQGKEPKP